MTSSGGANPYEVSPADIVDHPAEADPDLKLPADVTPALDTVDRYLAQLTGERPTASVGFLKPWLQRCRRRIAGSSPSRHHIRDGRRCTPDLGGTALAQVVNAVTVDRAATPEQFATFVAVVARSLGVPARIVSGFRLGASSAGRPFRRVFTK